MYERTSATVSAVSVDTARYSKSPDPSGLGRQGHALQFRFTVHWWPKTKS